MLGTVCLLLIVVIQLADVRNLARNPVSMTGLMLLGIISISAAFSIHRTTRRDTQ